MNYYYDNNMTIRNLIDRAFEYRKKGDFEKAAATFDEVSNYFLIRGIKHKHLAFKAHKIECEARLSRKNMQFDSYRQKMSEAENIWRQLGNEMNANWCRANIESSLGTECFKSKNYEEAIIHFNKASKAFSSIGLKREAEFNKAFSMWAEACSLKNTDPKKAAILASDASNMFQENGFQKRGLICKAESLYYSGIAKFREGMFQEAKEDFLKAAEISEKLGSEKHSSFYKAYVYQCDYRIAKLNEDIEAAIEALHKSSSLFHKAEAEEAYFVSIGDLHRLKGFKEKAKSNYETAIKEFQEARNYYLKAAETSKSSRLRHEQSAEYMEALFLSTEADCAMIFRQDLKEASRLYLESAERYKRLGDEDNASFNTNMGQLLRAVIDNDWKQINQIFETLHQYYKTKGEETPFSIAHNVIELFSMFSVILRRRHEEMMRELYEEDAGFNFEARVRELIMRFDGRAIPGSLIGSEDDKIILHKYDEVREAFFEPEDDEVGIVFDDKSIIEIDVLATRKERERRFILICECKYRAQKPISVSDLELLERKSKFIETRYGKIARLAGELKPIIEEKWFVTTGRFEDKCTGYARRHGIRLIDLKKLNNLLKEFGMRRLLGPRPKALKP